jgi:hypothetical protein
MLARVIESTKHLDIVVVEMMLWARTVASRVLNSPSDHMIHCGLTSVPQTASTRLLYKNSTHHFDDNFSFQPRIQDCHRPWGNSFDMAARSIYMYFLGDTVTPGQ